MKVIQGYSFQTHALAHPSIQSPFKRASYSISQPEDAFITTEKTQILRFSSKNIKKAGKNGLFVTPEPFQIVGGLGEVSVGIPMALNKYSGKDVRKLIPLLKSVIEEDSHRPERERFKSTGAVVALDGPDQGTHAFELLQRYERNTKTWVYAIRNDDWFGAHKHIYFPQNTTFSNPAQQRAFGNDPIFRALMMFNAAAVAFTPFINESNQSDAKKRSSVTPFKGDLDFVITNDWLTGPYLSQLTNRDQIAKIFILHNTYNEARELADAKNSGMLIPRFVLKEKQQNPAKLFSPLEIGIRLSDIVIADPNYFRSLLPKIKENARNEGQALLEKWNQGRVYPTHWDPGEKFNPVNNPSLKSDGFASLKHRWVRGTQLQDIQQFKSTNKLALQHRYAKGWLQNATTPEGTLLRRGYLDKNKDATIFSWVARFDSYQKGCFLMLQNLEHLLSSTSNAQVVIAGSSTDTHNNPVINRYLIKLTNHFPGRFVYVGRLDANGTPNEVVRLNAGSDFIFLPSMYEPYGLSQLEALKMGNIPIAHAVDGLRSTIVDPEVLPESEEHVPSAAYQQTGLLMPRLPKIRMYQWAANKQVEAEIKNQPLSQRVQAYMDDANACFSNTLDRAVQLAQNPEKMLQIRLNGMNYVNNEHKWVKIACVNFENAIQAAVALVQKQDAKQSA